MGLIELNELSLFTGAGGGILGSKLLGWRTLGYVEWDEYCQKVIAQRIKDKIFDKAPIFSDVRAFVSDGYARRYRGMVDVVTGGFPCQPFSVAGKRKASDDERNMWPATMDVIKAVRPPVVFLENVPGLLSATVDDGTGRSIHYFGVVLRDLAQSGYDVKWCVLGADDVGAPHHRKRLWILAYSKSQPCNVGDSNRENGSARTQQFRSCGCKDDVHANTECNGSSTTKKQRIDYKNARTSKKGSDSTKQFKRVDQPKIMADTKGDGFKQNELECGNKIQSENGKEVFEIGSWGNDVVTNPLCNGLQRGRKERKAERSIRLCRRERSNEIKSVFDYKSNWIAEPLLGRVANGVADRSNRLKAIGNGQVPLSMATAYAILSQEFIK